MVLAFDVVGRGADTGAEGGGAAFSDTDMAPKGSKGSKGSEGGMLGRALEKRDRPVLGGARKEFSMVGDLFGFGGLMYSYWNYRFRGDCPVSPVCRLAGSNETGPQKTV